MIGSGFPQTSAPVINREPYMARTATYLDVSNFERLSLGQRTCHNCIIVDVCRRLCPQAAVFALEAPMTSFSLWQNFIVNHYK